MLSNSSSMVDFGWWFGHVNFHRSQVDSTRQLWMSMWLSCSLWRFSNWEMDSWRALHRFPHLRTILREWMLSMTLKLTLASLGTRNDPPQSRWLNSWTTLCKVGSRYTTKSILGTDSALWIPRYELRVRRTNSRTRNTWTRTPVLTDLAWWMKTIRTQIHVCRTYHPAPRVPFLSSRGNNGPHVLHLPHSNSGTGLAPDDQDRNGRRLIVLASGLPQLPEQHQADGAPAS